MTNVVTRRAAPVDSPLRAALDEVRSRALEAGVRSVETGGAWPLRGPHESFMAAQRTLGDRLRRELLPDVFGSDDSAALGASPVHIFGSRGQRLRVRLPYLLAGPYEFGSGLCGLVGGTHERAAEAGRLCAVFNLCGALFDVIYDDYSPLFAQVARVFNQGILETALSLESNAWSELERRSAEATPIEVRLLLKSLVWSIGGVRRLLQPAEGRQTRLAAIMVEALTAELMSGAGEPRSERDWLETSRAKSVLPFMIMREVVLLMVPSPNQELLKSLDEFVSTTGASLWRLDDLADIEVDLRKGTLNSLVVQAGGQPTRSPELEAMRGITDRLLKEDFIDRVCAEIHTDIVRAVNALKSPAFPAGPAARLLGAFASYTRSAAE